MYTGKVRYIPRHAAESRLEAALREGMKQGKALWAQARKAARKARKWADKAVRAINAEMEEEMSEAGFIACGR